MGLPDSPGERDWGLDSVWKSNLQRNMWCVGQPHHDGTVDLGISFWRMLNCLKAAFVKKYETKAQNSCFD